MLQVYFFQTFKILETLTDLHMNNRAAQDYDDHSRGLATLEKVLGWWSRSFSGHTVVIWRHTFLINLLFLSLQTCFTNILQKKVS